MVDLKTGINPAAILSQQHEDVPALYVHVPMCSSLCSYCDFYKVAGQDPDALRALAVALSRELTVVAQHTDARVSQTVFFGGGTPNLLSPQDLETLAEPLRTLAPSPVEFTAEMNPEHVTATSLRAWQTLGLNRVSLGVQASQNDQLLRLERHATLDHVSKALDLVRQAELDSWSLDLMYALPGQSLADWESTLSWAIETGAPHLSAYMLTTGAHHPLEQALQREHDPDALETFRQTAYDLLVDRMTEAGYEHYEVSNFAKPGHACRHNLVYWRRGEYIAVGPSAAGFLAQTRYRVTPSLERWQASMHDAQLTWSEADRVEPSDARAEKIMLGLRLVPEGVDASLTDPEGRAICLREGLIQQSAGRLTITRRGLHVLNSVISALIG